VACQQPAASINQTLPCNRHARHHLKITPSLCLDPYESIMKDDVCPTFIVHMNSLFRLSYAMWCNSLQEVVNPPGVLGFSPFRFSSFVRILTAILFSSPVSPPRFQSSHLHYTVKSLLRVQVPPALLTQFSTYARILSLLNPFQDDSSAGATLASPIIRSTSVRRQNAALFPGRTPSPPCDGIADDCLK
jgi:hypothetical protein